MEKNEEVIAYLAEPSHVSENTGNITGKTVRCYEVKATRLDKTNKYGYTAETVEIKPTGKMFTLKDGKIIEKKTKAKLSQKSLSWTKDLTVRTSIKNHSSWSSCLYKTPNIAIAAKIYNIIDCKKQIVHKANEMVNNVSAGTKPYESLNTIFQKTNPEWYI